MKPVTFENLRRLVGGGRKKKDRGAETSFKRSESFKRISIKRNYLDRGGKNKHKAAKAAVSPPLPLPPAPSPPEEAGESVMIDYNEWIRGMQDSQLRLVATTAAMDRSPGLSRRRCDSALSVSLGRVWMDAPRSLELPSTGAAVEARRAHHSLESGLKETPRCPQPPQPITDSRDSGIFADFAPGGFFRKKTKPKPSVSRDGYFKRTGGSVRRASGKKNKAARKNASGGVSDMYQVVVSRPPRSLAALKLDPVIFVPPERRVASATPRRYEVREIRELCAAARVSSVEESEEEVLLPLGVSPVPRRRAVRRKKSQRATYVARPAVHRTRSRRGTDTVTSADYRLTFSPQH